MYQPPAKIRITNVADGVNAIELEEILYVFLHKDDMSFADSIRSMMTFLGTGICDTKNKPIDLYYDDINCKVWGVSSVKKERTFKVRDKPTLFGD